MADTGTDIGGCASHRTERVALATSRTAYRCHQALSFHDSGDSSQPALPSDGDMALKRGILSCGRLEHPIRCHRHRGRQWPEGTGGLRGQCYPSSDRTATWGTHRDVVEGEHRVCYDTAR